MNRKKLFLTIISLVTIYYMLLINAGRSVIEKTGNTHFYILGMLVASLFGLILAFFRVDYKLRKIKVCLNDFWQYYLIFAVFGLGLILKIYIIP